MPTSINIRPAIPSDIKFVADAMVQNLRENSVYCKGIHPATMAALVDPIVATYKILVAESVDADDPQLLGFLVYQDSHTVAFVYVRNWARSKYDVRVDRRVGGGVARALLAHAGIARAKFDEPCKCRNPGRHHDVECPRNPPEIACAFMVSKLDGSAGDAFAPLAERKGWKLRYRPYIPVDLTARVHYPSKGEG